MKNIRDSTQYLPGVGPHKFKILQRLGIRNISDLLLHIPRKYLDRSQIITIKEALAKINHDEEVTLQGVVTAVNLRQTNHPRKTILEVAVSDQTGHIPAVWFGQPYLASIFTKGKNVILSGKIKLYKNAQITSPEYEFIGDGNSMPLNSRGIIPCYPLTSGLTQKFFRRTIRHCIDNYLDSMPDELAPALKIKYGLPSIRDSLSQIHYPDSIELAVQAKKRLAYEELLGFQLALGIKRRQMRKNPVKHKITIPWSLEKRILRRIPFALTRSQEKVISEIKKDITGEYPMNRLLQGDVGSGKTIVAAYAILAAIGNRLQTALMVPTEILAEQHFRNISQLLSNSQVRITLLKSGMKTSERKKTQAMIAAGETNLVIGTHALIQKDVSFKKLGLLVIDEQHKFGVLQRSNLREKGETPHVLIMTATPIPRTMALTAFGDIDMSIINELPPGRRPVKTILRPQSKMPEAFDFIRSKISKGRQVYFVYPLIEDAAENHSDKIQRSLCKKNLKSATSMTKYLKEQVFPEYKIALLHGQVKNSHKEKIMRDFRSGKTHILVSTIVIEVGIDVPNASVMVIDHADRYGLAQLHQLRGRIGRGAHQSYCLIFSDQIKPESKKRLQIMEKTNDGFKIAEEDLRLRGPGEFLGVKQSGMPEFRFADLAADFKMLGSAKNDADEILATDPLLSLPNNRKWALKIEKYFQQPGENINN